MTFPRTSRSRLECLEDRCTPATFTVRALNDGGNGSLRDAIDLANAAPDADTIAFDPSIRGGTVGLSILQNFSSSVPKIPQPAGPSAFIVTSPITIQGTGETITRTGARDFRLFQVTAEGNLTLQNLTLRDGEAVGGAAGGGRDRASDTLSTPPESIRGRGRVQGIRSKFQVSGGIR